MGPVLSGPSFSEILPLVSRKGSPGLIMLAWSTSPDLSVSNGSIHGLCPWSARWRSEPSASFDGSTRERVSSAGFFWGASVTTTSLWGLSPTPWFSLDASSWLLPGECEVKVGKKRFALAHSNRAWGGIDRLDVMDGTWLINRAREDTTFIHSFIHLRPYPRWGVLISIKCNLLFFFGLRRSVILFMMGVGRPWKAFWFLLQWGINESHIDWSVLSSPVSQKKRSKLIGERQVVEALNYITWMAGGNKCLKRVGFSVPHLLIRESEGWFRCGSEEEIYFQGG